MAAHDTQPSLHPCRHPQTHPGEAPSEGQGQAAPLGFSLSELSLLWEKPCASHWLLSMVVLDQRAKARFRATWGPHAVTVTGIEASRGMGERAVQPQ